MRRCAAALRHQAAQDEVRDEPGGLFNNVEVVLQQQRIDIGTQSEMDRIYCLIQRSLALKLSKLTPFSHNLLHEMFDSRVVDLGTGPALQSGKRCYVVQLSIIEKQINPFYYEGLDQSSKTLGRRDSLGVDRFLDRRNDLRQAIATNGFTNGLFGVEELVDVRLGKTDRFREVGDGCLAVTVLTEMFVGRRDNLVSDVMFGGTAAAA